MKIVAKNASIYILDKRDRIVYTSPPIIQLADIYTAHWKCITEDILKDYNQVLIDNVSSFKALKHYVTGYICTHGMSTWRVPVRYIKVYERNIHLYKKD